MKNPEIKQWLWQRLWALNNGNGEVYICMAYFENAFWLHAEPESDSDCGGWHWLCPKPNQVLF